MMEDHNGATGVVLNDATRNQEFTMGSAPSDYTFGSALGTQEINTRASFLQTRNQNFYVGNEYQLQLENNGNACFWK